MEFEDKIMKMRSDIDSLATQMNMMNPAAFLEFRGTVIAALKEYDVAITALEADAKNAVSITNSYEKLINEKMKAIELAQLEMKTKAAVWGGIIAFGATILMNILIKYI